MIVLTLAGGVDLVPEGLRRGTAVTRVTDVFAVAALQSGLRIEESTGRPAGGPVERERIDALHRRALLSCRVAGVATATPMKTGLGLPEMPRRESPGGAVPLSRFALLRRDAEGWLLESGRSDWQVRLTGRGVAGLGNLALLGDDAGDLLTLLAATGMLADLDDEPAALAWEPHDRYFASRSRGDGSPAASYRLAGVRAPEPGLRQDDGGGTRIPLPVPSGPEPDEPSLWTAAESRRSVREFASVPVPLEALGALLWRTLRVVRHTPRDPGDRLSYDRFLRPVSSGGALHGTDLWLVCEDVEGVSRGVWRYDAVAHELVQIRTGGGVPAWAGAGPVADGRLPVVGLLTLRHARAAWKYGGIAYSLALKDVGVILHALNLTAGAVGLGMCAWGSGPTAAIVRLLGVDPEVDSPIGEFVLGVPRRREE